MSYFIIKQEKVDKNNKCCVVIAEVNLQILL